MIAIVDYGMGNLNSVSKALENVGAKVKVTANIREIGKSDKIVLPGVGNFADAAMLLKRKGLINVIKESIEKDKYFLGICLGLQLLFSESQEDKKNKGLDIIKGGVIRFKSKNIKVPHIGWNQIIIKDSPVHPLLDGIPSESFFYFCHSYYVVPKEKEYIQATTNYGESFACAICKDNLMGVQFHPEKSQEIGLKLLRNFVRL